MTFGRDRKQTKKPQNGHAAAGSSSRVGRQSGRRRGSWRGGQIRCAVCLLAAGAIALVVGMLAVSSYGLCVSIYEVGTGGTVSDIRIVQLADLHGSEFGADNQRLVKKVAAQNPDLILIAGDLLNSSKEDSLETAETLIAALCEIAPVYISYGNHEKEYEKAYGVDISAVYEAAGGTLLEYSYADIEVNGQAIRLGGIYGYCLPPKYLETGEAEEEECAFLFEMQNTDLYTILLCHIPVCWVYNDGINEWDIDCVFTGHVHGGQVIIPGIGGLWAPDMGWFPGRLSGLVKSDDGLKIMVYNRGLGNTDDLPRFNNIPEIVVVDLVPG